MSELIVSRSADGVVVVTLDRPRARNALSRALRDELQSEMARLQADRAVGAIVLTGSDPAFCSGMDVKELNADPDSIHSIGPRTRPLFDGRKPVIAAVNGPALTGGLELALACDWIVASERAVFGDAHARLGLHPGWGMTVLLAEAVGARRARQLLTTGRPLDAGTALAWGLVNELVPHGELLDRAVAHAGAAAANDRRAVATLLDTIAEQRAVADEDAWGIEARHWIAPPV